MATFRWEVGWLPPLTMSGMTNTTVLPGGGQLLQGLYSDGVADGLQGGVVQAVPVLGQARGIRHGLAGDKDIGAVGQLSAHQALAVLKIQFHNTPPSTGLQNTAWFCIQCLSIPYHKLPVDKDMPHTDRQLTGSFIAG